jgi:hypothetical protein
MNFSPNLVCHKYITKIVLDILIQFSSYQVSGHWSLAAGQPATSSAESKREARSQGSETGKKRINVDTWCSKFEDSNDFVLNEFVDCSF